MPALQGSNFEQGKPNAQYYIQVKRNSEYIIKAI